MDSMDFDFIIAGPTVEECVENGSLIPAYGYSGNVGKFSPGKIFITNGVQHFIDSNFSEETKGHLCILELISRHISGDWGNICDEDIDANNRALQYQQRIVSSYLVGKETGIDEKKNEPLGYIWIITEWNRSMTTVLLPDEY